MKEKDYRERCKILKACGLANEELNSFDNFRDIMTEEDFKEIIKTKKNRSQKRCRTKKKYKELYQLSKCLKEPKIVFGTITLDNKHLSLKEDTYIRKINQWLKSHFWYSILNKDFGSKTEREHYHFIGLTTEPIENKAKKSHKGYEMYELVQKDYELGFEPTLLKIDLKRDDLTKTINYLLKLNNHSSKIKTRLRIIQKKEVNILFEKIKEN